MASGVFFVDKEVESVMEEDPEGKPTRATIEGALFGCIFFSNDRAPYLIQIRRSGLFPSRVAIYFIA